MQLVIETFGCKLRKKEGCFNVVYPGGARMVAPDKVSGILMGKGTSVSTDALMMAVEHNISVTITDGIGKPLCRMWKPAFGSVAAIRKRQLHFCQNMEGLYYVRMLLCVMLSRRLKLLNQFDPTQILIKAQAVRIERRFHEIKNCDIEALGFDEGKKVLRGLEGAAAASYFEAIGMLLPADLHFKNREHRGAQDLFNMMLNYSYGILYNDAEQALVVAGLDPSLGILHRDQYNGAAFLYDFIEAYRPWAECAVLLLLAKPVQPENFTEKEDGGKHILTRHAKSVLITAYHQYLDEVISVDGKRRSRANHLREDAVFLASKLNPHHT